MLCDLGSLRGEIQHLKCTFQQNVCSKSDIRWALLPKQKPESKSENFMGIAVLPYQQAIFNRIGRLLAKYKIRMVHIPKKKNIHMLRPVKDDLGLRVPGTYQIPCECRRVYIG
jgi:hypothetical protein